MHILTPSYLSNVLDSLFSLGNFGINRRNGRYQENINKLLETVNLVREHRAITQRALTTGSVNRLAYDMCREEMLDISDEVSVMKHFDSKAGKNLLAREIRNLASDPELTSVANNLMLHGKVIRSLIFKLDEEVINFISFNDNEQLAGNYSENWQIVMSAIDALTKYRMALALKESELKPITIYSRGQLLLRKINCIEDLSSIKHLDSKNSVYSLIEFLNHSEMDSLSDCDLQEHYIVTSQLSALLLEVYQSIISKTVEQTLNDRSTRHITA